MATFTAYAAFNMNAYAFFDIATVSGASSTQVFYGNGAELQQIYGTDFTFGASSQLTGGTLTSTRYVDGPATVYVITELGLGAAQMYAFMAAGDAQGFLSNVLAGGDEIYLSPYSDLANGYAGIDQLEGRGGHDTLNGMGGTDILYGGAGSDVLAGGSARDFLTGDDGRDTLIGGLGADRFQLDVASAAHADVVKDFKRVERDKIVLDQIVYEAISSDLDLTTAEFRSATDIDATGGAQTASQHILYDSDSGRLYYDADGSATTEHPVLIARFAGKPALGVGDFLVQ